MHWSTAIDAWHRTLTVQDMASPALVNNAFIAGFHSGQASMLEVLKKTCTLCQGESSECPLCKGDGMSTAVREALARIG